MSQRRKPRLRTVLGTYKERHLSGKSKFGQKLLKFWTKISNTFKKIRKILGYYGFLAIGIFTKFFGNFLEFGIFYWLPGFLSPGFGIFWVSGFKSLRFRIFRNFVILNPGFGIHVFFGILYPWDRDFFSWDKISRQKVNSCCDRFLQTRTQFFKLIIIYKFK